MKLSVMGVMVLLRVLLAETPAAADGNGVDTAALLDLLDSRGLAAFTAHTTPAEETRYALGHAAKDLALQDLGRPGVKFGVLGAARTQLANAERSGLGGRDQSAIYGPELRPSGLGQGAAGVSTRAG
jgi:3-hydroxyisobutyrate dehydrogenase-like beta-hydroxyacid dehydrogenase